MPRFAQLPAGLTARCFMHLAAIPNVALLKGLHYLEPKTMLNHCLSELCLEGLGPASYVRLASK